MLGKIVDAIARREGPRILAGLIARAGGRFDLAEESLQEAYARALEHWPREGLPERPGAWLTTVARRRLVDMLRHGAHAIEDAESLLDALAAPDETGGEDAEFPDERLRLLFTCCHPALALPAQTSLALRTLCGLTTREIAHAFVEPEATTAQRIVRAKRKIADARIPYAVPGPDALPERLDGVLAAIYLVFNEGYAASAASTLVRVDLCREATQLADLLDRLMPGQAEVLGLRALLLLHDARREGRVDATGALVPLEEQDRSRWDAARIRGALALLDQAIASRSRGPYQLQAAIAALHAKATSAAATDWRQIVLLYGALLREWPTVVVELNAAAALAMAEGPERGLAWMEQIEGRGALADYAPLPASKADLLRRLGRRDEAAAHYRRALALTRNDAQRAYLAARLASLQPGATRASPPSSG